MIPDELLKDIYDSPAKSTFLIAIDGCGGSGKSTVAEKLASKLGNSQLVHIDDFYKPKAERIEITDQTPVHSNFDFERLQRQVLEPLGRLTVAKYQTADGKLVEIKPSGYIVVEGIGTLGIKLRDFFDYKIWVDSPESVRRQRGIARDSDEWTKIWDEEYLPQDAQYVREQSPQMDADWILNNN